MARNPSGQDSRAGLLTQAPPCSPYNSRPGKEAAQITGDQLTGQASSPPRPEREQGLGQPYVGGRAHKGLLRLDAFDQEDSWVAGRAQGPPPHALGRVWLQLLLFLPCELRHTTPKGV